MSQGRSKVTQLKAYRRRHRQETARKQIEGNIAAIGAAATMSWTAKQRVTKAAAVMANILAGLKLHGSQREAVDQAWIFMAASFDYALQELEGKGYDAATLKALGLEEAKPTSVGLSDTPAASETEHPRPAGDSPPGA